MSNKLENKISDVHFDDIGTAPRFVRPMRMLFTHNGHRRCWELVASHNHVSCVLIHVSRRVLICVRQFRPAVYAATQNENNTGALNTPQTLNAIDWSSVPVESAITYELCAGICDKAGASAAQTMCDEILEECGYRVPVEKLERITSFASGVGISGARGTLFYAEVDDSMRVSEGGGHNTASDIEPIEVHYEPIENLSRLLYDDNISRPPAFLFGITWFLLNKASKFVLPTASS